MIGYQGVPGAYSEQALREIFGVHAKAKPCADFETVFKGVASGKLTAGVVPIENSLAGSIHQNYDHLLKHAVTIVGEYSLRVRHNLLVRPGVRLRDLRQVQSHPQALAQCAKFLRTLKGAELVPHFDTAGAARDIVSDDVAAIASATAAENYGLSILKAGIEDDASNFTRFLVIKKAAKRGASNAKGDQKTSVVFSLRNIPGAMHKSLGIFALRDIDLFKIESRPLPGSPWQYLFYLDFAGSVADQPIARALAHLQEISTFLKVLGSYPRTVTRTYNSGRRRRG